MRGGRLAAGALAFLLAAVVSVPPPAGAARLRTSGWWWRAQTGQGAALPPPPYVPPGGLAVGNALDGPTAISAVRFELDPGEAASALKLTVSEQLASGEAPLALCLAASPWFGVQAGNWSERPEPRCPPVALAGIFADDGASVTFDLSSLAASDVVDLVIVPGPEAAEPFEISFEAPTAASLVTRPAPTPTTGFETTSETDFGTSSSQEDFPITFGDPIVPDFAESDFSREASPVTPDSAPQAIRRIQPLAATPAPGAETRDPRPLGLVILAAAGIAAFMLRREALPAPRLLGPMAGRGEHPGPPEPASPGGLGRFRRDRSGEPSSLA